MKVRVQVQLKEMLEARRGEVHRLLAALEVIRVEMYKVPGLRAGQEIHHKEKNHKVDHSKVVPNKVDLSKVVFNKVDRNKTHLNKVDPSRMDPSKVDLNRSRLNKTDKSKVVLNRRYIRKAKTGGEVSSKEQNPRGTQELVVSDLRSNYLGV